MQSQYGPSRHRIAIGTFLILLSLTANLTTALETTTSTSKPGKSPGSGKTSGQDPEAEFSYDRTAKPASID